MATVQRGQDAIIALGASLSSAVDLFDQALCGILMPAVWTAADLAFKVARAAENTQTDTDNTYYDLYDNAGNLVTVKAPQGAHIVFDADTLSKFRGVRHVKFVSWNIGTGAVTNQDQAVTIVPLCTYQE